MAKTRKLTREEKADAIATLSARTDSALVLLDAVEKRVVPRGDISAFAARQLFALAEPKVTAMLRRVWGEVRETPEKKKKQLEAYRSHLTPEVVRKGDPRRGRSIFVSACANCHRLHGQGGTIGPDLTGSNRGDLDYLLSNLIDPSAEVSRDFRMSVVRAKNGRTMTGIIIERSEARVVVQSDQERMTLSPDEVDSITESRLSIMPEGQLEALSIEQVRDLLAYLMGKTQVPLPLDPGRK
jgi:putative heme-binding domain-containing protein